jgi:hypothetical protein
MKAKKMSSGILYPEPGKRLHQTVDSAVRRLKFFLASQTAILNSGAHILKDAAEELH